MKKLVFPIVVSMILTGLFIVGVTPQAGAEAMKALDFTAKDMNGQSISLSSYHDHVVVLDFWATWCSPCRKEIPHLIEIKNTYKNEKFEIISIALERGNETDVARFINENQMNWIHIINKEKAMELSQMYNIQYIPAMFVIKNGQIVASDLRGTELKNKLKELLDR